MKPFYLFLITDP